MNCRKEIETPNPDYGGYALDKYDKYLRENEIHNTYGLSLRATADFILSDQLGCEIAIFGNVNDFKNLLGIEFLFLFGKTKGLPQD